MGKEGGTASDPVKGLGKVTWRIGKVFQRGRGEMSSKKNQGERLSAFHFLEGRKEGK